MYRAVLGLFAAALAVSGCASHKFVSDTSVAGGSSLESAAVAASAGSPAAASELTHPVVSSGPASVPALPPAPAAVVCADVPPAELAPLFGSRTFVASTPPGPTCYWTAAPPSSERVAIAPQGQTVAVMEASLRQYAVSHPALAATFAPAAGLGPGAFVETAIVRGRPDISVIWERVGRSLMVDVGGDNVPTTSTLLAVARALRANGLIDAK